VNKEIDGKESAYDDIEERRELEQAAKLLFGQDVNIHEP